MKVFLVNKEIKYKPGFGSRASAILDPLEFRLLTCNMEVRSFSQLFLNRYELAADAQVPSPDINHSRQLCIVSYKTERENQAISQTLHFLKDIVEKIVFFHIFGGKECG